MIIVEETAVEPRGRITIGCNGKLWFVVLGKLFPVCLFPVCLCITSLCYDNLTVRIIQ